MKSGQYGVVYYLFMLVISLSLLSGFIYLSDSLEEEAADEFGLAIMKNIIAGVNKNVAEVRVLAEHAESGSITKVMRVPDYIGNKKYYVHGRNNYTVARVLGDDFTDVDILYSWRAANVTGLFFGTQREVEIGYSLSDPYNVSIS